MSGDGDFCEIRGHGKKYKLKSGTQWCPHSDHNLLIHVNVWRVLWTESGMKKLKKFTSDPPTPAIAFARPLKKQGFPVEIISGKPFPPPIKVRLPDRPGVLWCPYCIKWREFIDAAIKDKDGLLGPDLLRCSICFMSIRDAYIRKYNLMFYKKWEVQQEMKQRIAQEKRGKKPLVAHRRRG